ncbi:trypsin-like serine peptidase [Nonomuraea sp. NPDC002799]
MQKALVTTLTTLAGVALAVPVAADRTPAAPLRRSSLGAESSPLMRPGRAVRYWTAGKQARAKAATLPSAGSGGPSAKAAGGTAEPRSVPSGKRLTPGGDPNGYVRVQRPYTGTAQSRISGRLFFVNASGKGDSCSASVVRSEVKVLIVTAAHCVYGIPDDSEQGRWHSSFAFVPAYDGRATSVRGREPYGRWGARRAWKPNRYTGRSGGDWNSVYDIALIEVGAGKKRRTLQQTVGAFTPMRNEGGDYTIATTGYPGVLGRKPYDGRDQLWCLGKTQPSQAVAPDTALDTTLDTAAGARAASAAPGGGRMETDNCHLFKGHSGGPWVLKDTDDLVGVLSAGKEDGEADGNSLATALSSQGYGVIVKRADPRGVYDALSVDLSGPSRPVRRGATATVTATVAMRGLMAAAQVPVTLSIPAGASLAEVSGATCERDSREATCTIGAVHPGRPVRISARVNVARDAGDSLPLVARVTSTRLDPSQRDNTSVLRLPTS